MIRRVQNLDEAALAEAWTDLVEGEAGCPWRELSSGIVTNAMLRCLRAHFDGQDNGS